MFHPLWQQLKHCFVLVNGSRKKAVTLVWLEDTAASFIRDMNKYINQKDKRTVAGLSC